MNMESTAASDFSSDNPLMTTRHQHMDMIPMWMWFHTTVNDIILFKSWAVTTPGAMVWSCFVVMAMGILLEFVRYVRWRLELKHRKQILLPTNYAARLFSYSHFIQTVCFAFQLVLSYLLMLIFMTFSIWLGLAVCIGAGYVFSCIGVAAIAIFYEIIKYLRCGLEKKINEQNLCGCDSDTAALQHVPPAAPGMPCGIAPENLEMELPFLPSIVKRPMHVGSSTIYFVQMFIAYSLMMIAMTYNVPIFLSIIIGHILGFFFLGPLISIQEYERLGDCCG